MEDLAELRTLADCIAWDETRAAGPADRVDHATGAGESSPGSVISSLIEIEGTLGQGGMGIVQRARQHSVDRDVAVKTIDPAKASPAHVQALLREAHITGVLEHPNIVPVYDLREGENGQPQVVLMRIQGTEWSELIDDAEEVKRRFGEDLLSWNLSVLEKIADALRYAHSMGYVHRDIKPSNVMVGQFGEVYLLDWGIAGEIGDDGLVPREAGRAYGTPAYMAPEMLRDGGEIGVHSDVYLLGSTLYEALTGKPPHGGANPAELVDSILRSEPPFPAGVPRPLQDLCRRAMRERIQERLPDISSFESALREFQRHRASEQVAVRAQERSAELHRELEGSRDHDEIYRLFGECRFGFKAALETWEGNSLAKDGHRDVSIALARYEIGRGEARAAKSVIQGVESVPDELRSEIESLVRSQSKRSAALDELARNLNKGTGDPIRRRVVYTLSGLSVAVPLATEWLGLHNLFLSSYEYMFVVSSLFISCFALVLLSGRRTLLSTFINRRLAGAALSAPTSSLFVLVGAYFMGMPPKQAVVFFTVPWCFIALMLTITIEKRFWPMTVGYGAAFLLAAWRMELVLYAFALCNTVMTINVAMYAFAQSRLPGAEDSTQFRALS